MCPVSIISTLLLLLLIQNFLVTNESKLNVKKIQNEHCAKNTRIRSFSGPYFPAFGLKTERYFVSLHIQSECGEIRTRKSSNTDTFHAVQVWNRTYFFIAIVAKVSFWQEFIFVVAKMFFSWVFTSRDG